MRSETYVPEAWEITAIDDVVVTTQYGLSMRGQAFGAYPILRMSCQEDGKVNSRDIQFVDLDSESYEGFRVRPGDLLFIRTNGVVEGLLRALLHKLMAGKVRVAGVGVGRLCKVGR